MTIPERPIAIMEEGTGRYLFDLDPPDDLWFSMLAFCEVKGITMQELIQRAVADFLHSEGQ